MFKYFASLSPRFSVDVLTDKSGKELINIVVFCHDQQLVSFYVKQLTEYHKLGKDINLYKRNANKHFTFSFGEFSIKVERREEPRMINLELSIPEAVIKIPMNRGRAIKFLDNYLRSNKRCVDRHMLHATPKRLYYNKDFILNNDVVDQLSEMLLPHFQLQTKDSAVNIICNGEVITDVKTNNENDVIVNNDGETATIVSNTLRCTIPLS